MNLVGFIGAWIFCTLFTLLWLIIGWCVVLSSFKDIHGLNNQEFVNKRRSYLDAAVLALISALIGLIPAYIVYMV